MIKSIDVVKCLNRCVFEAKSINLVLHFRLPVKLKLVFNSLIALAVNSRYLLFKSFIYQILMVLFKLVVYPQLVYSFCLNPLLFLYSNFLLSVYET